MNAISSHLQGFSNKGTLGRGALIWGRRLINLFLGGGGGLLEDLT